MHNFVEDKLTPWQKARFHLSNSDSFKIVTAPHAAFWLIKFDKAQTPDELAGVWTSHGEAYRATVEFLAKNGVTITSIEEARPAIQDGPGSPPTSLWPELERRRLDNLETEAAL
jgi:hypothetical protein